MHCASLVCLHSIIHHLVRVVYFACADHSLLPVFYMCLFFLTIEDSVSVTNSSSAECEAQKLYCEQTSALTGNALVSRLKCGYYV